MAQELLINKKITGPPECQRSWWGQAYVMSIISHSVLERIWVKGSYLSKWLPQGKRGPPKESKSRWIEILHGGSQFTLWFLKIKILQNFSDHSEIFFCFTIHKKLNKSCSLKKNFCSWKKKFLVWKKLWKKNLLVGPTVEDFNASWFWLLRGSTLTLW